MSEVYVEWLVKRVSTGLDKVKRAACAIVLSLLAITFFLTGNIVIMILAIAVAAGTYFVFLTTDVEFEYLYVDKELSVDKIFSKSRRRKGGKFEMDGVEIIAPMNSAKLDNFKNKQCKVMDYSSGVAKNENRFVMYYKGNVKVIFDPSKELMEAMRYGAPHKVHIQG